MIDEKAFIPHLQGCEMLVFTPDDWHVPCGDPATELVLSEGHRRYVCDWHYRGWFSSGGAEAEQVRLPNE